MGFWDKLGETAGKAVNAMQEKQERIEKYKARYCNYSDEELKKKFKNSSGDARMACIQLLKERGYGN